MLKKGLIFVLTISIIFFSLNYISAAQCSQGNITTSCQCSGTTYNSGAGFCCDAANGDGGVFFRGDYYSSCPSGTFRYVNYQNPSCSNSGTGTFAQPWCNMSKADTASSGNVVIFMGGTYNEAPIRDTPNTEGSSNLGCTLDPQNSGTAGNPTIFKGHPDYPRTKIMGMHNGPTYSLIMPRDGNYWNRAVCIKSSYITLEHFEITQAFGGGIAVDNGVQGITIQDNNVNHVYGNGGNNHAAIRFLYQGGKDQIVRGNELYGPILDNAGGGNCGEENCAGMNVYRATNVTVENNTIQGFSIGVFFKQMVSNSKIRRNTFTNNGREMDLWCPTLYQSWGDFGPDGIEGTADDRYEGDDDIYENVIYNIGTGTGIDLNNGGDYGVCGDAQFESLIRNVRIFNNVIFNGAESGMAIFSTGYRTAQNINISNNIVSNLLGQNGDENFMVTEPANVLNLKTSNNIYYDSSETQVISWPRGTSYTLAQFKALQPTLEVGSLQLNPQFLSTTPGNANFLVPAPGSPAIDNGTIIPGYHCTTSGGTTPVGCKVWYGAAPDIGAYEYNPGGQQAVPCNGADVNSDSGVNILDLALVVFNQGKSGNNYARLDADNNSIINFNDVNIVRNNMWTSC